MSVTFVDADRIPKDTAVLLRQPSAVEEMAIRRAVMAGAEPMAAKFEVLAKGGAIGSLLRLRDWRAPARPNAAVKPGSAP